MMEGPGADSEEKHEPVSDIDTAVVVVGLKALDPEWPIREAIGEDRTWARSAAGWTRSRMSSRPEEFHLWALPEPCMTLSSHTAPDVRPLP